MEKILNPVDISNGVERVAVALENQLDVAQVKDFVYVRHNIPGPYYDRQLFVEQYEGCSCDGNCQTLDCSCLQKYGMAYDNNHCLRDMDPFSSNMTPILECRKDCRCSQSCQNRVVQHGICVKLQVFKTKDGRGLGLRTQENLPKNSFVCEYAGEILPKSVAKERTMAIKDNGGNNYILVVREHSKPDIPLITTYLDPSYIGNVGRFINHSCQPNLFMVPVRVNNSIPKVALFALRDIAKGEELCYDYSGEIQKDPAQDSSVNNGDSDLQKRNSSFSKEDPSYKLRRPCLCGAKNCRGWLPFDKSLYDDDDG